MGVLQVDLALEKSRSLKDKRQVVKSVLARAKDAFNVSAAEVADQDLHQRAGLAFAAIGSDAAYVSGQLRKLLDHLRRHPVARVIGHDLELL